MLKITGSSEESVLKTFRADNNKVVSSSSGKANKTIRNLFRKLMHIPNIRAIGKSNFLTPDAKKAFNHLQLAFIKTSILRHFDLKNYIQIETDASNYAIGGVLN